MKIAQLSQSYLPMVSGAAVVARGLAEGMAKRSHDVMVLTSSERPTPYSVNGPYLTVNRFRSHRNPLRVGQRFTVWPHRQIMASLSAFHPDVIHLHDPLQFAISGLAYARQHGIPAVATMHQVPTYLRPYFGRWKGICTMAEKTSWRYCRWLLRQCALVVAPSQTTADLVFAETGITPQLVPYGIDPNLFYPGPLSLDEDECLRAKYRVPPQVKIVLHVGRLDKDKGVANLIHACASAMKHDGFHLVIAGDGTEKNALMLLCQKLGISDRVHFLGFVTRDGDLPILYRAAYAFVTASEVETQGLVLYEAAASGVPIVAVEATCIHEIVYNGINGSLSQPGDINEMVMHLRRLVENTTLARRMGEAGGRTVQSLGNQRTVDAYEAVYKQAVMLAKAPSVSPSTAWSRRAEHSSVYD